MVFLAYSRVARTSVISVCLHCVTLLAVGEERVFSSLPFVNKCLGCVSVLVVVVVVEWTL